MTETKYLKMMELEVGKLKVPALQGGDYQRKLNKQQVARIVSEFDPLLLGVLEVAFIEGTYWVWDGQHRVSALRILGTPTCNCIVAFGYTFPELAIAFGIQAKIRRTIGSKDNFRARLRGEESEYIKAVEIAESFGYRLDMSREREAPVALRCYGAIARIIAQPRGLLLLEDTLEGLSTAWGPVPVKGETLTGVATFIKRYVNTAPMPNRQLGYFADRLLTVLRKYNEETLIREARARTVDRGGVLADRMVVALRDLYNSGLSDKYRLPA